MFCPQCGSTQDDELKFCKSCGAHLEAIRQIAALRDEPGKFDWNRTWLAEMFFSSSERLRRKEEIERERGITPEMKRYTEIKAGVIVSSVGVGVMIFLNVLMRGIISSGHTPAGDAGVLSAIWVAGIIPFLVGLALIINGVFVSKRQAELARLQMEQSLKGLSKEHDTRELPAAGSDEYVPPIFGVTEGTTKHLVDVSKKR
jgi:hypothetical protein